MATTALLRAALAVPVLWAALLPAQAHAQVAPLVYAPGWNLAGGPPGIVLSAAEGLFTYSHGAYISADGTATSACGGYWAYFPAATSVNLPESASTTQVCPLQTGWTMVGNPFDDAATLPAGTLALGWDSGTQAYVPVASIPVGHAAWIWSPSGGSITVTSVAAGGVTVTAPPPPSQPVMMHAGQYLTVFVPLGSSGPTFVAHTTVPHLQFIDGNPVPGTNTYAYRWQAVSAGEADVILDPACLAAGCAQPSFLVHVVISP